MGHGARVVLDERESCGERTFECCRPAVMHNNLDREYERELQDAKRIVYSRPKCKLEVLECPDHFQNHINKAHGVKLWAWASSSFIVVRHSHDSGTEIEYYT